MGQGGRPAAPDQQVPKLPAEDEELTDAERKDRRIRRGVHPRMDGLGEVGGSSIMETWAPKYLEVKAFKNVFDL